MKLISIISLIFLISINCQSTITPRPLKPNLPTHTIQSIASLTNNKNTIAVLVTTSSAQTILLLYNTSDSNNSTSQLISSTTFDSNYYGRDLVAFQSNGVDWLAALFKIGNATQEVIGFFQPNDTKPQSTIQGGYRTTIYPNANIECQECILAALMEEDSTWTIKQLNFKTNQTQWSHHILEKYQQIFALNIAIGIGYTKYVINLLAISKDGSYIFLAIDYQDKINLMYEKLYKTDAFISIDPFYTDYLAVAFTNQTLEIMKNNNAQSLVQWSSGLPSGGVYFFILFYGYQIINCLAAYPVIGCGNLRQTNASAGTQINFWSYNITSNQTYMGSPSFTVSDTNVIENFISAPMSNQFIYADMNTVYVIDYTQVNSTGNQEIY